MTRVRPRLSLTALMWFGMLGAPGAWIAQFMVGFWFQEAHCGGPGRAVSVNLWMAIATGLALSTAVLAGLSAIAVHRATRDAGDAPPGSRVRFLATVGMTITPLFLAIIIFNALGTFIPSSCIQG